MINRWQSQVIFLISCFLFFTNYTFAAPPAELNKRISTLEHDVNALKELNIKLGEQIQAYTKKITKPPQANFSNIQYRSTQKASTPLRKPQGERIDYKRAQSLIRKNPTVAAQELDQFIKNYPKSKLIVNALYWLGEANYILKNYDEAANKFITVLKNHKKSSKASAAALKLGYTFYAQKKWDFAKNTLKDVIQFFPKTRASYLAKRRLAKMTNEGH